MTIHVSVTWFNSRFCTSNVKALLRPTLNFTKNVKPEEEYLFLFRASAWSMLLIPYKKTSPPVTIFINGVKTVMFKGHQGSESELVVVLWRFLCLFILICKIVKATNFPSEELGHPSSLYAFIQKKNFEICVKTCRENVPQSWGSNVLTCSSKFQNLWKCLMLFISKWRNDIESYCKMHIAPFYFGWQQGKKKVI